MLKASSKLSNSFYLLLLHNNFLLQINIHTVSVDLFDRKTYHSFGTDSIFYE